jgi:hypothetical protein
MEFIGLEAEASSVAVWHVDVVTGILQTERYARALMDQYSKVEPIAPAIIELRVELRMRRKRVLGQDPPLNLQVVLDESVLKRQFGDESVMYEQLQSLAAAATLPNVSLRILPLRAPHPVSAESFVIFSLGPTGEAALTVKPPSCIVSLAILYWRPPSTWTRRWTSFSRPPTKIGDARNSPRYLSSGSYYERLSPRRGARKARRRFLLD